MNDNNGYKHLERRPGSSFKQPFIKDRKLTVAWLYDQTIGEDARTPEEVADDFQLPLEAVLEAIDYCLKNPAVLEDDLQRELARYREFDAKHPPILPPGYLPKS